MKCHEEDQIKIHYVVVVLGYGCHLTMEMKSYLEHVMGFSRTHEVHAIICCGGETNRASMPGMSEAGMMAEYLEKQGATKPIYVENRSRTRNENFANAATIIRQQGLGNLRVVVFTDSARQIKARVLGRKYFGQWPEIRDYPLPISFKGAVVQNLVATPLDILSEYWPWLRDQQLKRREAIMNRS